MTWWHYLLLSNLYLILFYGFYALLLKRETFFQLNRIYLIGSAILSFAIPLVQSDWVRQWFITEKVRQTIYSASPDIIYQLQRPGQQEQITLGEIMLSIYLLGIIVLSIKLAWQLLALKRYLKMGQQLAAWSFFKKISVDERLENHQVIVAHEQVHARQWHSADVLLIEAIMIINWFNPIVYLYRRAIKHIHEFIADRDALKAGASKAEYAMLLLNQTFNTPVHGLLNPFFNHSLLKQRIIMLQKSNSNYAALIKYGFSAPLFALMLALSSATINNSKVIKVISKKAEQVFLTPADSALMSKGGKLKDNITGKEFKSILTTITPIIRPVNEPRFAEPIQITQPALAEPANTAKIDSSQLTRNEVFTSVEQTPEFPGGMENFYRFLGRNIRYPAAAIENKTQGRVIVTFVVEQDGSLSDVRTLRGPGNGLNEEAERVISNSPKWNAGVQNGNKVRVQYTVPVVFTIDDSSKGKTDTIKFNGKRPSITISQVNFTPNHNVTKLTTNGINKATLFSYSPIKQPLIIIDGKEAPSSMDLSKIDPKQIESISVLKDQSATKAYGNKGSNGVVMVYTKKDN